MQTITYEEVENLFKTKTLNYHNFYNVDIPVTNLYATRYYLDHKHDTIEMDQKLNILYMDIEVYTYNQGIEDVKEGKHPINIVTIRNSSNYVLHAFILLFPENAQTFGIPDDPNFDINALIQQYNQKLRDDLIKMGYLGSKFISDEFTIDLKIYGDERQMLYDIWNLIHDYDPDILTSWNGDYFDFPYFYYRLCKIYDPNNARQIMSKFGQVEIKGSFVSIFEYTISDLLTLYKPRSEGGLNYGDTQANYTLDNVAEEELGLKKVEYKDKNLTLDDFFIKDPYNALLYNLVDVLLIIGLNRKMQHIDLHNLIRRLMTCPFHSSMVGSSALFEHFVFYKLSSEGKVIRYGINRETQRSLDAEKMSKFPVFSYSTNKGKKIKQVTCTGVEQKSYGALINKFPGAFVNQPVPNIINDGSLIIDLDATALYPSMILQSNISFDSYRARIIPPVCHTTLKLLEAVLGTGQQYPPELISSINKMAVDYVQREDTSQKEQTASTIFYTMLALFDMLYRANLPLSRIFNPTNTKESILLKTVLVPLLDIMNTVHPNSEKHNTFAYDYLMLENHDLIAKYPDAFVLYNPNESNAYIQKLPTGQVIEEIKKNIITLSGTLFAKHNEKIGLFADFLLRMQNMRNEYRAKLKEYPKDSLEYEFNNNRQKSVKVVMNTTYGLYGLSSFRYSNHWLARSITNNGIFTNKIAQWIAEDHLKFRYGGKP